MLYVHHNHCASSHKLLAGGFAETVSCRLRAMNWRKKIGQIERTGLLISVVKCEAYEPAIVIIVKEVLHALLETSAWPSRRQLFLVRTRILSVPGFCRMLQNRFELCRASSGCFSSRADVESYR